ncbi:hypothetical protein COCMIDRAFT_38676 [Bipolaris oryzae ATCC 44560]|uniref:CFEM domain-containing protein n=1 Tax=Bipolaris oryzae ATCC 44560 TaxID=930090 RepID=W6ZIH9_COCMI|nr:uncharacterized protein COCMIDRAFT_38676 [Bipolaris oryzae ATCC 44560]EUC43356.1 hypothetical protein COCMIDRAFT_38676 [Bipolaris oryzae ATCC 44560]
MHFRLILLVVVCALLNIGHAHVAGSDLVSRKLGINDIPECGLVCMISAISTSHCTLEDINCICGDKDLTMRVGSCMVANCTMQDSLGIARVQADVCNLSNDSKRQQLLTLTITVYVVCFICVVGRTAGKIISKRVGLDDYIVVGTWLLGQVPIACALTMIVRGFGDHLWNLEDGALMPILRLFYIAAAVYGVVLGLIKVALLLSYLNIFIDARFRLLAYMTMVFISTSTIIIFFLSVFLCSPIESFWNRNIKGKCISPRNVSYANSASAIVQDLILLALPLIYIRNLRVNRWRKYAVGFMFATGTFGCIATMIRMHTLTRYNISFDPTWDYAPLVAWTELELAAGCVCVSLPAIRLLVTRLLPNCFKGFLSRVANSTDKSGKSTSTDPQLQAPPPSHQSPSQQEWYRPLGRSWMSIGDHKDDVELSTVDLLPIPKAEIKRDSNFPQSGNGDRSDLSAIVSIGCISDRSYSEEFIRTGNGMEGVSTRSGPS